MRLVTPTSELRKPLQRLRAAFLAAALLACAGVPQAACAQTAPLEKLGIFSLLGNSVRVVARELQEVMFKDVGMDDIALNMAHKVAQGQRPQAAILLYRAPEQVSVDEQIQIGTGAGRRGELPAWVSQAARVDSLTHVLIITSYVGAMEFRTATSEVVGNNRVSGIGFYVGADGRTTNLKTGAVSSGYLAPFIQLRMSLIELASGSVLSSSSLSDGFIVGPPTPEAPDPWRFMDRASKSAALQQLLTKNIQRGAEDLFKPR